MSNNVKIFTKNFWCAFFAAMTIASVMWMLVTNITQYALEFGTTTVLAGLISSAYVLGGLITRLWAGSALEKYGWKRLAYIGLVLHVVACVGYFFVHDALTLIFLRLFHGLMFGIASTAIEDVRYM